MTKELTERERLYKILYWGLFFPFLLIIVQDLAQALNDEALIQNYEIGLIFMAIFGVLYVISFDVWILRIKKFHYFMFGFFLSWFVGDIEDFWLTIAAIFT